VCVHSHMYIQVRIVVTTPYCIGTLVSLLLLI